MKLDLHCEHAFTMELLKGADGSGPIVHAEDVTADMGELVEEAWLRGVLAGRLPLHCTHLRAEVRPVWSTEPLVDRIEVVLAAQDAIGPASPQHHSQTFASGRWSRRAIASVHRLRESGALGQDETALSVIYGQRAPDAGTSSGGGGAALRVPPLQPPEIVDQSLEEFGVVSLGDGDLDPDRPVLVNERMVEDIVRLTEEAGASETGGGTLGKLLRLPEPLPGTNTRIVTLLTTSLTDPRHVGEVTRFTFSPEALAAADEIAHLRGFGEAVLTVFHTHGWGTGCDNCNESAACVLPQCTEISLEDYTVLESMLPGKATLMPVAGRKLGAPGRRPVLEIHAWKGGQMRSIGWRTFRD